MFWSEPTRIYRGRAELREWLDRVMEPWETLRFEVEEMTEAADDLVFGGARLTGRGRGSGVQTEIRGWFLYKVVGVVTPFVGARKPSPLRFAHHMGGQNGKVDKLVLSIAAPAAGVPTGWKY